MQVVALQLALSVACLMHFRDSEAHKLHTVIACNEDRPTPLSGFHS